MRLAVPATGSREPSKGSTRHLPLHVLGAFKLAFLVAILSLGGILLPSTYVRETPNWAAQAVGQDWVDLLVAVPWLVVSAALAKGGSRRGMFALAGGLLYVLYELVIYCFAVHLNSFFLLYCAALGLSFFALASIASLLVREGAARWYSERAPVRVPGIFLIVVGALFGGLWLADIVPALLHGTVPDSIVEAGVPTNPVYVVDLSVVLPLHVIAGISLCRRKALGYVLAPILLAFGFLMALSIAGMMVVMRQRGIEASLSVAGAMAVVSAVSGALLASVLRGVSVGERGALGRPAEDAHAGRN